MAVYVTKQIPMDWNLLITLTFCVFFAIYLANREQFGNISSVRCSRDLVGNKMCKFQNIRYNRTSQSFEFFYGPDSVITGIVDYKDLQTIQLSSIKNHNAFYANLTMTYISSNIQCDLIIRKAFVFSRFKPDNLMHVIHDDLLPLFVTLDNLCSENMRRCLKDWHILILDQIEFTPYHYLYEVFNRNILLPSKTNSNICFDEIHMGFDLQSVWYDYGFEKNRGPAENIYIDGQLVNRFKNFLFERLSIIPFSHHTVILKRPGTRKLLNTAEIASKLTKKFNVSDVVIIDVTPNNTKQLLEFIVNADHVIGMHGAEMIFNLFINSECKVIELFPFGITADLVSFLKPLHKKGILLNYYEWTNKNRSSSVRHAHRPPHIGGIGHLPHTERVKIEKVEYINSVKCCDDPAFLHLMYQDTVVDSDFFEFLKILLERRTQVRTNKDTWYFPGAVQSLTCKKTKTSVFIEWQAPVNVYNATVQYNVLVTINHDSFEFLTLETTLVIGKHVDDAHVWVAAVVNSRRGVDRHMKCTES